MRSGPPPGQAAFQFCDSISLEAFMADAEIRVRPLNTEDRELLLRMYRSFDPLGGAQGLPPRNEEIREIWIDRALKEKINVGAFSAAGDLAGHSFLASSDGGDTELAVFVHQGSRRRGIGTAMVRAVLQRAEQTGLRRIRATAASENFPALRFLKRWGFRSSGFTYAATELHLELPTLVSKG
jgi:RimJ/RimL family protein N-acetyltransferase